MRATPRDLAVIGGAFAAALAVYLLGAAPDLLFGDSVELQTVALLGGVAHPTGYPLFVLVGRVFARLAWWPPAFRITFMTACFAAAVVASLIATRERFGLSRMGAAAAATLFGSMFSFWSAAQRAEVYSVAMLVLLLAVGQSVLALRTDRKGPALLAGLLLGLSVCGHFMAAPVVLVAGLALAWHSARSGPRPLVRLALLLGAFVLGLTPYLYIPWADTHGLAVNYLRDVDLASHPLGRPPGFDSPWERLAWLLLGRDHFPALPFRISPWPMFRGLAWEAGHLLLFEPGLLAWPVVLLGGARYAVRDRKGAALIAGAAVASLLFAALAAGTPRMIPIFILPGVLMLCIFAGHGFAWLAERLARWTRGRAPSWAAGLVVLTLLVSLGAHATRVYAARHPIGRLGLRFLEEAGGPSPLIPSRRNETWERRYGLSALRLIPRDALVVGEWDERMLLRYLQAVEGLRPDLQLQPLKYPEFLPRLSAWQRDHSLARRPIVFLGLREEMAPHLGARDTVQVDTGRWLVIVRSPLKGLPPVPAAGGGDRDPF